MMTKHPKKETETQTRIRQLRDQINALDRDEVRPFTPYKIITYGCTVFFPLVPYALYRLGGPKTEFSSREQILWSLVIAAIAVYAAAFAL